MKIAIVGCGALGSYYGACLARAGHDVHFLLRSDLAAVRSHGVQIKSPDGDFTVHPHTAAHPSEIGISDLVVIGLKTTANPEFPRLLPPLVGHHTAVLTLQNGLGNEETLATLFPPRQILGGLCFVCINRTGPGQIEHIAHGRIVLGEFSHPPAATHGNETPSPQTELIAAAFRQGGVPCDITPNLNLAHWQKLVWNVPFNGLGVASAAGLPALASPHTPPAIPPSRCLTSDQLLDDPHWLEHVRGLMNEVIATANAHGLPIPADYAQFQIDRTREMGAYRASTLIDFEEGRPLEIETLFIAPLREAIRLGVATPHLRALCRVLVQLAASRNQFISLPD
jgi:2-dehydropantoate 2-reductase